MRERIAIFRHIQPVGIWTMVWCENGQPPAKDWVRITDWVDVDFPELPGDPYAEQLAAVKAAKLVSLEAEIAKLKGVTV